MPGYFLPSNPRLKIILIETTQQKSIMEFARIIVFVQTPGFIYTWFVYINKVNSCAQNYSKYAQLLAIVLFLLISSAF